MVARESVKKDRAGLSSTQARATFGASTKSSVVGNSLQVLMEDSTSARSFCSETLPLVVLFEPPRSASKTLLRCASASAARLSFGSGRTVLVSVVGSSWSPVETIIRSSARLLAVGVAARSSADAVLRVGSPVPTRADRTRLRGVRNDGTRLRRNHAATGSVEAVALKGNMILCCILKKYVRSRPR